MNKLINTNLDVIHESWFPIADYLKLDPKLVHLNTVVLPAAPYRPAKEDIFKVFRMPVNEIKVVIFGQSPYFNDDATGLAYQVKHKPSKALKVIYKQLELEGFENPDISGWEKQGVFLLNTALTVKAGKADTHTRYWQDFIEKVVSYISNVNTGIVWLCWGKKTAYFIDNISKNKNHIILTASYPATEMYKKSAAGFYGCDHFTRVNEILSNTLIKW